MASSRRLQNSVPIKIIISQMVGTVLSGVGGEVMVSSEVAALDAEAKEGEGGMMGEDG